MLALRRSSRLLNPRPREPSSKIRNIGVIAHIDAGKTTTTERFLFYSGELKDTRAPGGVDAGSTVTDFLEEERKRGITIQAAAVSFNWPPQRQLNRAAQLIPSYPSIAHDPKVALSGSPSAVNTYPSDSFTLNLIDTPGHADFVFEVRRALAVLDGAVVVLDSSRGVQAQTYAVYAAARQRGVRTIAFFNKCDKVGADVATCAASVQNRLRIRPVVLSLPIFSDAVRKDMGAGASMHIGCGRLTGFVDVLSSNVFYSDATTSGTAVAVAPLSVLLAAATPPPGDAAAAAASTAARAVALSLGFPSALFEGDGVFGSHAAARSSAAAFATARAAALDGLAAAAKEIDGAVAVGGRARVATTDDTTIRLATARPAVWPTAKGSLSDALIEASFELDEAVDALATARAPDAIPSSWRSAIVAACDRAASALVPPAAAGAAGGPPQPPSTVAKTLATATTTAVSLWPTTAPLPEGVSGPFMAALRAGMAARAVIPCFCGASARNIGVQPVLDAVISLLPPPAVACTPTNPVPTTATSTTATPTITPEQAAALAAAPVDTRGVAFCFKVTALAGADHLEGGGQAAAGAKVTTTAPPVHTYVRVYSGAIRRNTPLRNLSAERRLIAEGVPARTARNRGEERCGGVFKVFGKSLLAVDELAAGDVGVVAGLSGVATSDTLVAVDAVKDGGKGAEGGDVAPLVLDNGRSFALPLDGVAPPPGMFMADVSVPTTQEKALRVALGALSREDPSIRVDDADGVVRVGGLGRLHLEILSGRLARDFTLEPFFSRPTVSLYDTIAAQSQLRCAYLSADDYPAAPPKAAGLDPITASAATSAIAVVYRLRPIGFVPGALDDDVDVPMDAVAAQPLPSTARIVALSAATGAVPVLLAGPAADKEDDTHASALAAAPLIALAAQAAARRGARRRPVVGFAIDVFAVTPVLPRGAIGATGQGAQGAAGARSLTSRIPDWYAAALQTAVYNDVRQYIVGRPPLDRCPMAATSDYDGVAVGTCDVTRVPLADADEQAAVAPATSDAGAGGCVTAGRDLLAAYRGKAAADAAEAANGGVGTSCDVVGLHPVSLATVTLVDNSAAPAVGDLLASLGGTVLHDLCTDGDGETVMETEVVCQLPASQLPTLSEQLPSASRGMARYSAVPRWLERFDEAV